MILEALSFDFFRNALMAGLLVSVICGVIGSLVVVNRIVFLAGGVAHASYGGVGLAFHLGLPVLPVTAAFSTLAALGMAWVTLSRRERADTIIGVLWAAGMALGIILLDLTPGYNADLMSYLFGSILAVPDADLKLMAWLCALVLALAALFSRGLLVMSFDMEFARARRARALPALPAHGPYGAVRGHGHPRGGPHPGHGPADHPAVHRRAPRPLTAGHDVPGRLLERAVLRAWPVPVLQP